RPGGTIDSGGPCGARSLRSLRPNARAASAARPRPRASLGEASLGFAPTSHRCGAARAACARARGAARAGRAAAPARPSARRRRALRRAGRRPRDAHPQPALARPQPADRRALLRAARGPGRRARRPPRRRRDLGRCGAASGPTAWRDAGARGGPPAHPRPPPPPRLRPRALGGRGAGAAFRVGWLGGFVFYLATVYWVAYTITNYTAVPFVVAVGILALMASVLACYTAAFVAGVRWLEARGLPALWLAPLLWVA